MSTKTLPPSETAPCPGCGVRHSLDLWATGGAVEAWLPDAVAAWSVSSRTVAPQREELGTAEVVKGLEAIVREEHFSNEHRDRVYAALAHLEALPPPPTQVPASARDANAPRPTSPPPDGRASERASPVPTRPPPTRRLPAPPEHWFARLMRPDEALAPMPAFASRLVKAIAFVIGAPLFLNIVLDLMRPELASQTWIATDVPRAEKEARLRRERCDGMSSERCEHHLACLTGKQDACFELGLALELGKGGDMDLAGAVSSYEQACRMISTDACHRLAGLYRRGHGVTKDLVRAAELDDEACRRGFAAACTAAPN